MAAAMNSRQQSQRTQNLSTPLQEIMCTPDVNSPLGCMEHLVNVAWCKTLCRVKALAQCTRVAQCNANPR